MILDPRLASRVVVAVTLASGILGCAFTERPLPGSSVTRTVEAARSEVFQFPYVLESEEELAAGGILLHGYDVTGTSNVFIWPLTLFMYCPTSPRVDVIVSGSGRGSALRIRVRTHAQVLILIPFFSRDERAERGLAEWVAASVGELKDPGWTRVRGRVLDDRTGRPVAGAEVILGFGPCRRATTGTEGEFSILWHVADKEPSATAAETSLGASCAGYARKDRRISVSTASAPLEVRLAPEGAARRGE